MALLETFRYKNFVTAEEAASTTDSKGSTMPRFNGDPAKLMEHSWRVRARIMRENMLPEDEQKKLGPLGLRLAENLSGAAMRVAQLMSAQELAADKGAETLLKKLAESLRPRRIQEARELYSAGAQPNGILSRQPQEPMSTYLVRRQAWHSAMVDLNSDLKLPDLILAEQTLNQSGISENMQLLIRSALGADMTMDKVCSELIAQHSRLHERESSSHHRGKGSGKHWRDRGYRQSYMAEETYDWETAETYHAENEYAGETYGESQDYPDEVPDEGELLAMLAADGLDLECEESMDYAAEVIQADLEAYYTRDRAVQKGIKGFKGKGKNKGNGMRHFDVTGQLSLSERQQRLQQLKSRTSCRRCGQVGHWSGDPSCPKGKGKGKSPTNGKSDGKGNQQKPRTVYFAVHDHGQPSHSQTYMALNYNAVPPPTSLQDGQTLPPRTPDPRQPPEQLQIVPTQVADGQELTADELDTMMLVSSLGVAETRDDGNVVYEVPPAVAAQLSGFGLPGLHSLQPGHSQDLPRLPERLSLADFNAAFQAHETPPVLTEVPVPQPEVIQRQQQEPETPKLTPVSVTTSPARTCAHVNITTKGSNGYYTMKRCIDCGVLLSREPKVKTTSASASTTPPTAPTPGTCQHSLVSWAGTNGFRWKRTCRECGLVTTGPVTPKPAKNQQNASSSNAAPVNPTMQNQMLAAHLPRLRQVLDFALKTKEAHTQADQFVSSAELHMLLDYSVGVASLEMPPQDEQTFHTPQRATPVEGTPQSRTSASTFGPAETLEEMGQHVLNFGKYKNQTYYHAWLDLSYVDWALAEEAKNLTGVHSMSSGLKRLCHYFKEMRRQQASPATGFMALKDDTPSNFGSENDILAILDTGCNATCHGSAWYERFVQTTGAPDSRLNTVEGSNMRGIGGNMKISGKRFLEVCFELSCGTFARGTLPSLEIENSKAPLLLSLETQRQLGFKIDIPNHVVYSSTLGSELKLVLRDGLLAIRLIPGYLGLQCTHEPSDDQTNTVSSDDQLIDEHLHAEPEEEHVLTPEAHLAVDKITKTALTKGQKKQLKDTLQDVKETDGHMWDCLRATQQLSFRQRILPKGCKTFLLEIFAGAALLSMIAADCGAPVSQPVDLRYDGIDLRLKQCRDAIDRQIEQDDPYAISFSPVCGPWSPWQNINVSKDPEFGQQLEEVRSEWRPVIKWVTKVMRERLAKGRQVLLEQPWMSQMWNLLCMQMLIQDAPTDAVSGEHLEVVRFDQCQYGLHDEKNFLYHKKPTGLLTASPGIKEHVSQTCNGFHEHQPLEGSNRTKKAQEWPQELCEAILTGLFQDLERNMTMIAFPAEAIAEENPIGSLDMIYDPSDLAPAAALPHRADEAEMKSEEQREEQSEAVAAQDAIRKQEWLKLPYAQRVAIRRLHQMTGHASCSALARMLRIAKASPEVIHRLKYFKCEACQQTKRPEPRPVVRPPNAYTFNYEISADCFECRDALGNRFSVFSVVCLGTLYHCAWIVSDQGGTPSSLRCAESLRDGWLTMFGAPRYLTVDRGVANRGRLAELVTSQGIYLRFAGKEAAHQIGRCERQGGILKEMISHAVQSRHIVGGQAMRMAVSECCFVKNNRINHGGFSPSQWVLGRLPIEICSLTTEQGQEEVGVHQEILTGEHQFAQQLNIRQAAKESFAHVDSSQRIRTVLMRRSTPLRGPYHPGDLLCFHRENKWYGPARMIGREGRSNLWLIHAGIPIVIAEEKVRPALAGEVIAKQITELRPSRKRKRQLLQDSGDAELPFGDDLNPMIGDGDDQGSFFHLGRGGDASGSADPAEQIPGPASMLEPLDEPDSGGLPVVAEMDFEETGQLPPGFEAPSMQQSPGLETDPLLQPPPGLVVPPEHPPLDFNDMDDYVPTSPIATSEVTTPNTNPSSSNTRPRLDTGLDTEVEPDQEALPDVPTATETPRDPRPVSELQEAMRRSVNRLDGHPRRDRSRSPRALFATQTEKQQQQAPTFHGFLGRRAPKKNVKKKGAKELNYDRSDDGLRGKIEEARAKEWSNWNNFEACEVISPEKAQKFLEQHSGAQVVPTRWVDVNKSNEGETPFLKSRLVVRGDLEKSNEYRTDSPTGSHLMLSLLLSFCSCSGLTLHCGDITAAFLQGYGLARVLLLSLPKGGIPGVKPGSILCAKKPVYGTRDAPRGFWRALHKTMLAAGFRAVPHELGAYVKNTAEGKIDGLVVCHVDDLLWCGGPATQKAMEQVQQQLKFGKVEKEKFNYCGRTIEQTEEGIVVTCPHGLERTRPINLSTGRKKDRNAPATAEEQGQLRSILGSLNWVVRVNRPDLAYDTNRLQTCVQKPVVQDLVDANSLLRRAQMTKDQKLIYGWRQFDFNQLEVISVTDASHAADFDVNKNGEKLGFRSQSGRVLLVGGPEVMKTGKGAVHLISWKSQVIRRVCRSTLQAESLSMLAGYEEAEHLRMVLHGLRCEHDPMTNDWKTASKDEIILHKVTDCRSLQEHLTQVSGGEVHDKRLAIDICGMRQMVWRERGQDYGDTMLNEEPPSDGTTRVQWCSTKTMMADGLTKHMDTSDLRNLMSGQQIKMDFMFHAKDNRGEEMNHDSRLQWSHHHTQHMRLAWKHEHVHQCISPAVTFATWRGSSAPAKKVPSAARCQCGVISHMVFLGYLTVKLG